MKLVYENKRGRIVMYGGGADGFNITQIRGISLPESDVSTIRYPNVAGQTVTRSTPMERMITVSADIKDENRKQITRAMGIFSYPGVIYITAYGKTKKINARCVSFEVNKNQGAYVPFVVQFCADNPYFEDIYECKTPIYNRVGKLHSTFVLGCVFSERMLNNNVINRGDTDIEPVFEISSESGASCPEGITIKNATNGNTITLNTDILIGEKITVDVKNRKITSNIRGNMIFCLSEETALTNFVMPVGISAIEVLAPDLDGKLNIWCLHNNNYISVVV